VRRREFISLLSGIAVGSPLAARAQPGRLWRIGFIAGGSRPVPLEPTAYGAFSRGMRELGYMEGKDFIIEWRFAEGRNELFSEFVAELVRLNVDVIVTGTPSAISAAQRATKTIPIVMGISTDPVGLGYIASLAHPGGNTTGLASSQEGIAAKQIQLLSMLLPNIARIGFLLKPDNPQHRIALKSAQDAIQNTPRTLVPVELSAQEGVADAFAMLAHQGVGAVMSIGDSLYFLLRKRLAEMAIKARLPTIFAQREYVEAGALMSYGDSLADFYRRAAFYVDKIFRGAKPSELPVQQPTQFFLVINRTTAKTIGVDIPLELLVAANEVIE
jgi:putative ABC transport system substrate-binding protein